MDMTQFTTGQYLDKSEVDQVNGTNIVIGDIQGGSDATSGKPVLVSPQLKKPMILNKTNIKRLAAIIGGMDSNAWIGQQVNVFNDPMIEYQGQIVGGLRLRPVQQVQAPPPAMQPIQYPPATPSGSGTSQQQGPEGTPPPNWDPDVPF